MGRFLAQSLIGFLATVSMFGSASAFAAGELDNEAAVTNEQIQLAKDLPATLVMRVNDKTKEVSVLHMDAKLEATEASKALLANAQFKAVDVKSGVRGELDQDSSSSSWYFCFNNYNWSYPTYYYYGYNYNYSSYYNYSYGGYSWYYYRWGYSRWY
jgi:hypothetical protein